MAGWTRYVFVLGILFGLFAWPLARATSCLINATSITVAGTAPPGPRHNNTLNPTIAWTSCGGQTSYQVCVGKITPTTRCWYYDSGTSPADGTLTSQTVSCCNPNGGQFDWSAHEVFVSIRTAQNGEAITSQSWVETTYHRQQNPKPPIITRISASSDASLDAAASRSFATAVAGDDWYADPASAVTTPCTSGTPCTLQGALNKIDSKGDTVHLACGSYPPGNYTLPSQNGDESNPITIVAASDGCAHIQSNSCTSALTISSRQYWSVDGIAIGNAGSGCDTTGAASGVGLRIVGSSNIRLRNIHSDPNTSAPDPNCGHGSNIIGIDSASSDVEIINPTMTHQAFDFIDVRGCARCSIRGGTYTNGNRNSHVAIEGHGSSLIDSTGLTIEGVNIYDMRVGSGAIAMYLATNGSIRDGTIRGVKPLDGSSSGCTGNYGPAISLIRSDQADVSNMTLHNNWAGIVFEERVRDVAVRNNIITNSTHAGISWAEDGQFDSDSTLGNAIEYNDMCGNLVDWTFRGGNPNDPNYIADLANNNCKAGNNVACSGNACDPKLHDPNSGDYSLDAGSYAIDRAKPGTRKPTGGGSERDIGAYENGGSGFPLYTSWQSAFTVATGTPRIDWIYLDGSNRALAREPWKWFGSSSDSEARFQCQVDEAVTFDSHDGHPRIDTLVVTQVPAHYGWNIAGADTLPAGVYFVRCSDRDANVTGINGTSGWGPPVAVTVQ